MDGCIIIKPDLRMCTTGLNNGNTKLLFTINNYQPMTLPISNANKFYSGIADIQGVQENAIMV